MNPNIVYSTAQCSVGWQGGSVRLQVGQHWAADDPFVKARPEFFSDTSPTNVVHRTTPVVEDATARPGEKRGARAR